MGSQDARGKQRIGSWVTYQIGVTSTHHCTNPGNWGSFLSFCRQGNKSAENINNTQINK